MSTAEIKATLERMTQEERFFAAAYLRHLAQAEDGAYQSLLGERMRRMDEGKKVTHAQVEQTHEKLETEGL